MPRFKLLRGMHSEGGKLYMQGDVFDSAMDLLEMNNGYMKFAKVDGPDPVTVAANVGFGNTPADQAKTETPAGPDEFDTMTIPDLKRFAEAEGIDLSGVTKRDDILATVRAAVANILAE